MTSDQDSYVTSNSVAPQVAFLSTPSPRRTAFGIDVYRRYCTSILVCVQSERAHHHTPQACRAALHSPALWSDRAVSQ